MFEIEAERIAWRVGAPPRVDFFKVRERTGICASRAAARWLVAHADGWVAFSVARLRA